MTSGHKLEAMGLKQAQRLHQISRRRFLLGAC
jgi:hypothetical protein